MKKIYLFALLLTFCAQLSCAASFDCAKASTATEKLICSDEKVSALDAQLGTAYKAASETAADKDAFKTQQRDWLKQKRNVCTDADCLVKAYQIRIQELTVSPAATTTNTSTQTSSTSSQLSPKIPNFYFGKYRAEACLDVAEEKTGWRCIELSWSNIDIAKRDNESVFFTVKTRKPGGHGCMLSGIAKIKGEFLIGSGKANFGEGICTLTFKFESETLAIERQDEQCGTMALCGYGDTFTEGKIYKQY